MPRYRRIRSWEYAQALDLRGSTVQSLANRDSPDELGSPLSDLLPPPHDLVAELVRDGHIPAGALFEMLYGGRTNQVWKVKGKHNDTVLKLYRTTLRNPLFRNDAGLEAACLNALQATGFVPNLRATRSHGSDRWVLYDHAPGEPWRQGTGQVGRLLRKLHAIPVTLSVPGGCNGSADLTRHAEQILAACTPTQRNRLAGLRPTGTVGPAHQICLVHGDPVPGNILVAPKGLTLIDWQCPALGDPCEDLAMFLSPAMQHLYRAAPLTAEEEIQFLAAYNQPDVAARYQTLRPWYAWRMAAYCLWRAENGAPDYLTGFELEIRTL